jgi:hypothetical protein
LLFSLASSVTELLFRRCKVMLRGMDAVALVRTSRLYADATANVTLLWTASGRGKGWRRRSADAGPACDDCRPAPQMVNRCAVEAIPLLAVLNPTCDAVQASDPRLASGALWWTSGRTPAERLRNALVAMATFRLIIFGAAAWSMTALRGRSRRMCACGRNKGAVVGGIGGQAQ